MDHDHLAALVRAVAQLRPAGPLDPALVTALAELLAPPAPPPPPSRRAGPIEATRPTPAPTAATPLARPRDAVVARAREDDARTGVPSTRPAHDPTKLIALPSSLIQIAVRADLASPRQGAQAAAPQAPSAGDAQGPAAPLEGLFPPGRVRAILRTLSTLSTPTGQPDLIEAIAMIARAEPIKALPQRVLSSMGHAVQLLFDAGPAMLPFARDKQQLAAAATRLLGKDRVRIADFIADPLEGVRAQRQVRWEALHWPGRRSAVVVVSDLGLSGGRAEAYAAREVWQRFLDEASQRGLRTVVLIPYARERWPAVAARFGTALTWDLATGVQALRRSMRAHTPSPARR